jgi:hypothetical protein
MDPGWRPAVRRAIPVVGWMRARRDPSVGMLTVLRSVSLSLSEVLVLLVGAFSYIAPGTVATTVSRRRS